MTDNLAIWDKLARTDPAHTKSFNRSGGFKGTAVKPIWTIKKLTEMFGPCGKGWGFDKPEFQVVPCDGEILVFCTVSAWHGSRADTLFGVGGDKVQAKRSNGPFNDDESFKKAFTDAIGNAFKFIGLSADIHMGQFDDNKYVEQMKHEFSAANDPEPPRQRPVKLEGPYTSKTALWQAVREFDRTARGCGDIDELDAYLDTPEVFALLAQVARDAPQLADKDDTTPPEFEPLNALITRLRTELTAAANEGWQKDAVRGG